MFESYPQAWIDVYAREGLLMVDPTVHWAMHNPGVVRWANLESQDRAGVLRRARDFGIEHGLTRSIHAGDAVSFGGLARSDRDFLQYEIDEIGEIIQRMHDATADLQPLAAGTRARIHEMAVILTQRGVNLA